MSLDCRFAASGGGGGGGGGGGLMGAVRKGSFTLQL